MLLIGITIAAGLICWMILLFLDRRRQILPAGNAVIKAKSDSAKIALINYDDYRLTFKEKVFAVMILGLPMALIGFIFYKNGWLALIVSLFGLAYPRIRRRKLINKRKNKLNIQFKQALSCLTSSLGAGKSVESAFQDALADLKVLYPDPSCLIVIEFEIILRRLENGEPIEAGILALSRRAGLEDVSSFADVFVTCKRTGGNLIEVMKRTSQIISEKLEIEQDISVMVAQKRFESRVLIFAPVIIVAVLSLSSPEYMEPLYQGAGIGIMSAALLVLTCCFWLTQKIMNIKV